MKFLLFIPSIICFIEAIVSIWFSIIIGSFCCILFGQCYAASENNYHFDTKAKKKFYKLVLLPYGGELIYSYAHMIKPIFWDNDGVLVNTEHLYFLATKQTLASIGVTLSKEQFIELILVQGKGAWHLAKEKGVSQENVNHLRRERDALYARLLNQNSTVIDGARRNTCISA